MSCRASCGSEWELEGCQNCVPYANYLRYCNDRPIDPGVQPTATFGETKKWDLVGIGLSILCAIHCLGTPLILAVLPFAGIGFVADHEFEWVMMGIIFLVAGITYIRGYRYHGRKEIFWFLLVGVLVFGAVRPLLPEGLHAISTLFGASIFILGHWKNWHWHRLNCRETCCDA